MNLAESFNREDDFPRKIDDFARNSSSCSNSQEVKLPFRRYKMLLKRKYIRQSIPIISLLIVISIVLSSASFVTHASEGASASYGGYSPTLVSSHVPSSQLFEPHNISVGSIPHTVAYDSATNSIYVANSESSNVSVINASTNKVVASITVGIGPWGMAYDSATNSIYVANSESSNVSVINASTNKVVANINVGLGPYGVAYDSANNSIFVTVSGLYGSVSIINASTNKVVENIGDWTGAYGIAYDSANNSVFIVLGSETVILNASTYSEVAEVYGGVGGISEGWALYVRSDNSIYISDSSTSGVLAINGSTYVVEANNSEIRVGASPSGLAYDNSDNSIYVVNWGSDNVSVISASTNKVVASINVGPFPTGIAYDSATNSIYVAISYYGEVTVISLIKSYTVTFTESGLPSGTTWYVNLTNGQTFSSSSSTVSFTEPNGTYSYTISSNDKTYQPSLSSGTFAVNGASVSRSVSFSSSVPSKNQTSPSGISDIELYGIIGGVLAVAVIGSFVMIMRRKK